MASDQAPWHKQLSQGESQVIDTPGFSPRKSAANVSAAVKYPIGSGEAKPLLRGLASPMASSFKRKLLLSYNPEINDLDANYLKAIGSHLAHPAHEAWRWRSRSGGKRRSGALLRAVGQNSVNAARHSCLIFSARLNRICREARGRACCKKAGAQCRRGSRSAAML